MAKKCILILIAAFSFACLHLPNADACTDFTLTSKDKTIVVGRSMEFAVPMESLAIVHPRGEDVKSIAPKNKPGKSWTNKYGYVGITSYGKQGFNDGMNEKGLSVGFLWMPGTAYQHIPKGEEAKAIEILDFGGWLLGNFASVKEVRKALPTVKVWGAVNPLLKAIPPIHVSIHDEFGKNLIIEFLDGVMKVHENPIGVLTNAPSFEWQIENLRNYVNLSPFDTKGIKLDGVEIAPTGHGSGLHGLPGDMTPPSRFVRTVYFKQSALPAATTKEAINLAEHLLNAVDIPKGADVMDKKTKIGDYTQWAVIKDLTHKILYYRTYDNITLRSIDLSKVDFSIGKILQI